MSVTGTTASARSAAVGVRRGVFRARGERRSRYQLIANLTDEATRQVLKLWLTTKAGSSSTPPGLNEFDQVLRGLAAACAGLDEARAVEGTLRIRRLVMQARQLRVRWADGGWDNRAFAYGVCTDWWMAMEILTMQAWKAGKSGRWPRRDLEQEDFQLVVAQL